MVRWIPRSSVAARRSRRKIGGMGSLAAALFLVSALANSNPCKSPQTQAEMNVCAEADFRRVDARLNAAYNRLFQSLDPNRRLKLQRAERAWLAFRDAHCIYEASDSEGGSIHRLEVAGCKTELTTARIGQLRE